MGRAVFITGGARSGKSAFALSLAAQIPGPRAFIATMEPRDEECAERIRLHKLQRGPDWHSYEEPLEIESAIARTAPQYEVVVLDCVTLWLSNLMHTRADIASRSGSLVNAIKSCPHQTTIIVVSNEVGLGIVPENALARSFRDHAGALNSAIAAASDEAWLVVSGIPLKIK